MKSSIPQTQIDNDLALNYSFAKGQEYKVKNCWHCCLMNTHVHFIIYGGREECIAFIREYIRLTSVYMAASERGNKMLQDIAVSCQAITTGLYLKTAICYVLRNPFVAGLPFLYMDYPWSSASLYFRSRGYWTSSIWDDSTVEERHMTYKEYRKTIKSRVETDRDLKLVDGLIYPSEYIDVETVEKIFRTHRVYGAFMCLRKEDEVELNSGEFTRLSMGLVELRENRKAISRELFATDELR